MTFADRLAAGIVLLAGAFLAWACARAGAVGLAVLAGAAAAGLAARQAISWTQSKVGPRLVLQRLADGRLQATLGGGPPAPLALGPWTRLLGPSVFLDVAFATATKTVRCRRWITPRDVPVASLRRWTVLLPSAGSLAS